MAPSQVPFAMVDAFTLEKFRGNPAAVCVVPSGADPAWMQLVAAEFNVSETAFLEKNETGEEYDYGLRWFTPVREVDLCGHATLASAFYLFSTGRVAGDLIRFQTRSGILFARKVSKDNGTFQVELNFPLLSTSTDESFKLVSLDKTLKSKSVVSVSTSDSQGDLMDLMVELASREMVETLEPNMAEISRCCERGLIVTARVDGSDSELDFVSRFFAPKFGIDEDPVCGSAHCALAPYWSKKLGKNVLKAFQVSKRGGHLELEVHWETQRVSIKGNAVVTLSGVLSD